MGDDAAIMDKNESLVLEDVAKALKKRRFVPFVVPSLAEAVSLVMQTLLPESGAKSVAFGGSGTIVQSGLLGLLKEVPGLNVMDTYDTSNGLEAMLELRRHALLADLFFCSANAVTADGKIFLLDGYGNRTAAVQYGPKKVVLLVGKNKICKDAHAAFSRVRNVAAPANAKRLSKKTPCFKLGHCANCASPDRICSCWTILEWSVFPGRVHVVLVDEDLGF